MNLREACAVVGIDTDPLGCSFVIVATMRTAAQGEPSTFEGDLSSLEMANTFYDVRSPDGVRQWLDDLGDFSEHEFPDEWWIQLVEAAISDDRRDHEEQESTTGEQS